MIASDRKLPRRLARTDILTHEEWLALRWQNGIGSSDASAVLGYNKYRSPRKAFDDFLGLGEPFEGNEATECGILLEDDVIELYERRTGNRCERIHAILQDAEHDFMLASVDRRVVGSMPRRLVEAKTSGEWPFRLGDWGNELKFPAGVPPMYYCQLQHLLRVAAAEIVDLPLLVGGQKYHHYLNVPRDEVFINAMIAIEGEFWAKVLRGRALLSEVSARRGIEPGALTESLRDRTAPEEIRVEVYDLIEPLRPLAATYEEASESWESSSKKIQATSEILLDVEIIRQQNAIIAEAKALLDAAKTRIGNYMRDSDELTLGNKPVLTWRTQSRAAYTVKASTSRVMRLAGDFK